MHINDTQIQDLTNLVHQYKTQGALNVSDDISALLHSIAPQMSFFLELLTQAPEVSETAQKISAYGLLLKNISAEDMYIDEGALPGHKIEVKKALIHSMILSYNDPKQLKSLEFAYQALGHFQPNIYSELKTIHVTSGLSQLPLDQDTSVDMHHAFIAAYSSPEQKKTLDVYKDVHQKAQEERLILSKELKAMLLLLKIFKGSA